MIPVTYRCVSLYGGTPLYCFTAPGPALYAARASRQLPNALYWDAR